MQDFNALDFLHFFGFKTNRFDIIGIGSGWVSAIKCANDRIQKGKRVGKIILIFPKFFMESIESKNDNFINFMQSCSKENIDSKKSLDNSNIDSKKSKIINHQTNPILFYDIKQECNDFTHSLNHYENCDIAEILSKNGLDISKITKKSSLFVAFLIQNDRIAILKNKALDSNVSQKEVARENISEFFAQYGICFMIKSHALNEIF